MAASASPQESVPRKGVVAVLIGLGMTHTVLGILSFGHQAFRADSRWNDVPHHILLTVAAAQGHREWPSYTLYNQLLYLLAGLESDVGRLAVVSVVVLSSAMVARAVLAGWVLRDALRDTRVLFFVALAVTLAMPIFNWWRFPSVYLGQISPTIWHNPTAVLALPLALWLFVAHLRARESLALRPVALVGLAMLLNAAAKPSYLLAFAPVVGADLLWRGVRGPRHLALRAAAIYFGPLALVLGYQYLATFAAVESGIVVSPLQVWRNYSPNIPASLLLSTAFPIAVAVAVLRQRRWSAELSLAWACFGLAVAQMSLLVESNDRVYHANFWWGSHITLFVLFVISARALFGLDDRRGRLPALIALGAHALAGLVFYLRSFGSLILHNV